MTRTLFTAVALACGLLAPSLPALAQDAPAAAAAPINWFEGTATLDLLGRDDVDSSKFEEYRVVPKGVSMPVFNAQPAARTAPTSPSGASNIAQRDQRYTGLPRTGWAGADVRLQPDSPQHGQRRPVDHDRARRPASGA